MKHFLVIITALAFVWFFASESQATSVQAKGVMTVSHDSSVNDDNDDDDELMAAKLKKAKKVENAVSESDATKTNSGDLSKQKDEEDDGWYIKTKKTKKKEFKKDSQSDALKDKSIKDNANNMSKSTEDDGWHTKGKGGNKTKKQKPFYDVKSQLLGVSGDVDSLAERGLASKMFYNKIKIDKSILPVLDVTKKKKGWDKNQIATIEEKLNDMRVGHELLTCLFLPTTDENGNFTLSDERMNKRALQNAQYVDIEKANVGAIDATTILRDDWTPLLKNNYIYLEISNAEFFDFIVLKFEINDDVINAIYNNWNNAEGFEAINPEIKCVYSGSEKFKNPQKFQRKLSENVPAFAIRGQLTGRNPATAHIGLNNGLKKMDLVSVYRQTMDKDGEMVSKRISRARVNYVEEENCQMVFTSGNRGSYKNGDMVVLTPDKKQGIGIYGNYTLGNFFGASLIWDQTIHISKSGFAGHVLGRVNIEYADYEKSIYDYFDVNPPIVLHGGFGYGLGWTLAGRFELMPYVLAEIESIDAPGKNEGDNGYKHEYDSYAALALRASGGLRFDINIAYPIKLSIGAEYGHQFFDFYSDKNENTTNKTIHVPYADFQDLFKKNDYKGKKKLNRDGVNFYVGIRYVF